MDKLDQVLEKMKLFRSAAAQFPKNVIPIFKNRPHLAISQIKNIQIPVQKTKKLSRSFPKALLPLQGLVLLMSYFLITETAQFFESADQNVLGAYLKAFILEGIVLAFTVMRAKSMALNLIYKSIIVLAYLYGAWIISSSAIHSSLGKSSELQMNQKIQQELEIDIVQIKERQEKFFKEDRITLARKYDQPLAFKHNQLEQVRKFLVQTPSTGVIWSLLASSVIFRLIVMLSNILCIGYISRKCQ